MADLPFYDLRVSTPVLQMDCPYFFKLVFQTQHTCQFHCEGFYEKCVMIQTLFHVVLVLFTINYKNDEET